MEEHGLSIFVSNNCLPPSIKECSLSITADLTTNIALPYGSVLVSAVYHIRTTPFIERFNQPVGISMVHCANDFSQLSFVFAKEQAESKFEYSEGGTFEIDAKTGMKIGKIDVSCFSKWAIVTYIKDWLFGVVPSIAYCGSVYYNDSGYPHNRIISFVITKNLPLAEKVRSAILLFNYVMN